jgi:dihydroorotate dehydrogenase
MLGAAYGLARQALFCLEPEQAHELTLRTLELGLYPRFAANSFPSLRIELMGLTFANPLCIAAGFDKDGRVPDAVLGLGCGFAEVGTITPRPQSGNPRPRVFRLPGHRSLINRLGFNNEGHAAAVARLSARKARRGIVGVNIGANKDSADKAADYVAGLEAFYGVASYFVVNISSPNTPGLRDLQAPAALDDLLGRVMEARTRRIDAGAPKVPIVVKIAPDIAEVDLPAIIERIVANGADAIAVSNTTLTRRGLENEALANEAGGLSGRPLFHRATVALARVYVATGGRIPLIGVGGIDSGTAALAKIEAGASLIQLYTGLIYEGPDLIRRILAALTKALGEPGAPPNLAQLVGRSASHWSRLPLDG